MTDYDSLLLDFDGVLVTVIDRERRVEACLELAISELDAYDFSLDYETITTLSHSVSPGTLQSMSEQLEAAPEELWQFRDNLLAAVLQDAAAEGTKRPYPDIAALSELSDVPLGIVSNNQLRVVEFVLDEYEFGEQFETVHAREPRLASLQDKKPEPTMLERARVDLAASNPLYVGDKQKDVVAARRAGMDSAFLRRGHNRDRSLEPAPTYEITGLDELLAMFEASG